MMPSVRLLLLFSCIAVTALAQVQVEDIFGRSINQRGITLVDWDGYMANPLIRFYLRSPTNSSLPGTAVLTANGVRLYFDTSSSVSANGPMKSISLSSATSKVAVGLSIFPDRDGLDEDYTLTIVFTDATAKKQTNFVPIHVIDQDLQRTNDFVVTENFDRDVTGFFTNATKRALVKQAADDWAYFFADMNLDTVKPGAESTYIWYNNFSGGYNFTSTNSYRGYLLYPYGTVNDAHRSGGESSYSSPVQSSGGVALKIKRSGGFEAEINGNYNTLGWLLLTNDNDWRVTGNLGSETNDFYSIAHHEIGHALIFNHSHPGFNTPWGMGAFSSAAVTNYYGSKVSIDSSEHLNGAIDPESKQGAFGYEYYGSIPRKRWLLTKLDLLAAQEVGYVLRPTSAFVALGLPARTLSVAIANAPYNELLHVDGGIPFYNWDVISGTLPTGVELDSFTGTLTGKPTSTGTFTFTIRVRDYHETAPSTATQNFTLQVNSPAPRLDVSLSSNANERTVQVALSGSAGRPQVIQVSSNLTAWQSVVTNSSGVDPFQFFESNVGQLLQRFYRSVTQP